MEPPARDDDAVPPPFVGPPPNTGAPKVIGVLNIVFGCLLLVCGICSSLNLALQSALGPMMAGQNQGFQQAMRDERQRQVRALEEQEKAAEDEKEKAELRAQQKAIQARPLPQMPDMSKFARDVQFQVYFIVDMASGFLLNIAMIVAGAGLCGLREWGRVAALWVAGLKIVRLVAVYGFFALAVVPGMVQQITATFREMFDEMAKAGPPGQKMPGAAELAQMSTAMGVMMTAGAIVMVVLGVIYPAIVLIVLTRPRVKAACARRAASGPEPAGG